MKMWPLFDPLCFNISPLLPSWRHHTILDRIFFEKHSSLSRLLLVAREKQPTLRRRIYKSASMAHQTERLEPKEKKRAISKRGSESAPLCVCSPSKKAADTQCKRRWSRSACCKRWLETTGRSAAGGRKLQTSWTKELVWNLNVCSEKLIFKGEKHIVSPFVGTFLCLFVLGFSVILNLEKEKFFSLSQSLRLQ